MHCHLLNELTSTKDEQIKAYIILTAVHISALKLTLGFSTTSFLI